MSDFSVRSENVDVEQIMGQIRARIREKRGVDYTEDEIRELANVKLEKFIDPKGVRSGLLEEYRRVSSPEAPAPNFAFGEDTLYETHRGPIRWLRALFRPFLKLLFNPNPLIQALHIQADLNTRNAERAARRAQLDALHYEVIHNLVVELTRTGVEVKSLKMRLESMASRLDFDERRARALEGVVQYRAGVVPPLQVPAAQDQGRQEQGRRDHGRRDQGPRNQGPRDQRPRDQRGRAQQSPVPQSPVRQSPVQQSPVQQSPVQQSPEGPGTQGPIDQRPGTHGLGTEGPGTQGPIDQRPGTQGPGTEGPGTQGPITQGLNNALDADGNERRARRRRRRGRRRPGERPGFTGEGLKAGGGEAAGAQAGADHAAAEPRSGGDAPAPPGGDGGPEPQRGDGG